MNIKLLKNKNYLARLFKKRLPKYYPNFGSIKKIEIYPVKNYRSEKIQHFVGYYTITDKSGRELNIVCSAHSDGTRKRVFKILRLVHQKFKKIKLLSIQPLWYQDDQKAMFYRAIRGENMFETIEELKESDSLNEVRFIIKEVAHWLAKFHQLKPKFRLPSYKTTKKLLDPANLLTKNTPLIIKYRSKVEAALKLLINLKNKVLNQKDFCLVHGDLHPENVIVNKDNPGKKRIAIIDYTDVCLSDPAQDLGSFTQQLIYNLKKAGYHEAAINSLQRLFIKTYLGSSGKKLSQRLKNKIIFFQAWSAARGMIYLAKIKDQKKLREFDRELRLFSKKLQLIK